MTSVIMVWQPQCTHMCGFTSLSGLYFLSYNLDQYSRSHYHLAHFHVPLSDEYHLETLIKLLE